MADADTTAPRLRRTRLINLVGQRFGLLTVIERGPDLAGRVRWAYVCDCGNRGATYTNNLRGGLSRSCGCVREKQIVAASTTHGMTKSSEFRIWANISQRCSNPRNPSYPNYGGRGIHICDRWRLFDNFYDDMGPRPSKKHSIDRMNNNGNYEPDNCRWATIDQQMRNRSVSQYVLHKGSNVFVKDLANMIGVNYSTLMNRIYKGDAGDNLIRPAGHKPI